MRNQAKMPAKSDHLWQHHTPPEPAKSHHRGSLVGHARIGAEEHHTIATAWERLQEDRESIDVCIVTPLPGSESWAGVDVAEEDRFHAERKVGRHPRKSCRTQFTSTTTPAMVWFGL